MCWIPEHFGREQGECTARRNELINRAEVEHRTYSQVDPLKEDVNGSECPHLIVVDSTLETEYCELAVLVRVPNELSEDTSSVLNLQNE